MSLCILDFVDFEMQFRTQRITVSKGLKADIKLQASVLK